MLSKTHFVLGLSIVSHLEGEALPVLPVLALPSAPNKGGFGGINRSLGVAEIRLQNPHMRKHNTAVLKILQKTK